MNSSWPGLLASLSASAIVLALSACGGDSESPATLTLGADSADVAWNAPSDVDVLANDKASRGTLSLSALSAPAHGTAVIADGKVRYTPASGYFGPDELTYTVTGADAVTSTAKLSVAVNASLALSGTVTDGPIASAVISAAVGTKTVAAAADPSGAYSVTIRTANPADMVVITATGVGTQSKVKLVSAVGDAAALAAQAGTTAKLTSAQLPALNVTHLSSALLALVTEANGAKVPSTQAQFDSLALTISPMRMVELAAAIKLVVDHGVALPAGVSDTLSLIDKPASSASLASFIKTQATGEYPTALDTAKLEVQSSSVPAGLSGLAATAPQTLFYFIGYKLQGAYGTQVTFKPDGTARVLSYDGSGDATWVLKDGEIAVTLLAPFSSQTYSADVDPVSLEQYLVQQNITGYRFRHITGSLASGSALAVTVGNTTPLEGVNTGVPVPYDLNARSLTKVLDITAPPVGALALTSVDLPTGTLLAGVAVDDSTFPAEDVLSITGSTTASFVRVGRSVTWAVADGWLKVTDGATEHRYRRVSPATSTGEQHWIVANVANGVVIGVNEQLMVNVTPGLAFTADASLYRQWQSGIDDFLYIDVFADGTGGQRSVTPDGTFSSPTTWAIDTSGHLIHSRSREGAVYSQREWTLLRREGGSIFVMESLNSFQPRLNVYADGGAATP